MPAWSVQTISGFLRILVGCFVGWYGRLPLRSSGAQLLTRDEHAETAAFHAGIMIACYIILRSLDLIRPLEAAQASGIRREFRSDVIAETIPSVTLNLLQIFSYTAHASLLVLDEAVPAVSVGDLAAGSRRGKRRASDIRGMASTGGPGTKLTR